MMKFETARFGEIEFPEEDLIFFPEGIPGFPNEKRYLLLEDEVEDSPFRWLQSVDSPSLGFIVLDATLLDSNYSYEIDRDSARVLETDNTTECAVISIVNIPHGHPEETTVNLKAPLVINIEKRLGIQIIQCAQTYSISTPLFTQHDRAVGPEKEIASDSETEWDGIAVQDSGEIS